MEFEAIESISEKVDGRLQIVYFLANKDGNGFSKKSETFECFEVHDIIKVFTSIRNLIETQQS